MLTGKNYQTWSSIKLFRREKLAWVRREPKSWLFRHLIKIAGPNSLWALSPIPLVLRGTFTASRMHSMRRRGIRLLVLISKYRITLELAKAMRIL